MKTLIIFWITLFALAANCGGNDKAQTLVFEFQGMQCTEHKKGQIRCEDFDKICFFKDQKNGNGVYATCREYEKS